MNRYIFNVRASYFDETHAIVEFLAGRSQKIAVFYQNDAYGQAGLAGVEKAMSKYNTKPVGKATVERNSTDVTKAVDTIEQAAPQAVIMISAYKSCAAFITAMKKKNPGIQFWNVSFVGSRALADELQQDGRGIGISQVVPFPWDGVTPVV